MFVVQALMPLTDGQRQPFPASFYYEESRALAARFGGLTVYARAPATGLWDDGDRIHKDEIAVYEVMAETLESEWWREYRRHLEIKFCQETVVVRATAVSLL